MVLVLEAVLFFAGMYLLATGSVQLERLRAHGKNVRYAGGVLMLPMLGGLLLGIVLGIIYGIDVPEKVMLSAMFLRVSAMFGAAIGAGLLINADRDYAADTQTAAPPTAQERQAARARNILNIEEAATYLKTSAQDVRRLIDDGKLPAARSNGSYAIARSALDDLVLEKQ